MEIEGAALGTGSQGGVGFVDGAGDRGRGAEEEVRECGACGAGADYGD